MIHDSTLTILGFSRSMMLNWRVLPLILAKISLIFLIYPLIWHGKFIKQDSIIEVKIVIDLLCGFVVCVVWLWFMILIILGVTRLPMLEWRILPLLSAEISLIFLIYPWISSCKLMKEDFIIVMKIVIDLLCVCCLFNPWLSLY